MDFPSWESRGSSTLAAKEGSLVVQNNVMDNDKENIICYWKVQSWGERFEMVLGDWSSMNQPAGTPPPRFALSGKLHVFLKATAKPRGACATNLVNSKPIKMLNLMTFHKRGETLVLT